MRFGFIQGVAIWEKDMVAVINPIVNAIKFIHSCRRAAIVTAVSSVTIGFVIRLNKPNYGIDKYGVQ